MKKVIVEYKTCVIWQIVTICNDYQDHPTRIMVASMTLIVPKHVQTQSFIKHDEDNELMAVPTRIRSTTTISMKMLNRSRRLLYISHFFTQFSENAWQFAPILFLAAFVQYQSLIYVSTYGIISNAAVCLFSSAASTHVIDRSNNRLRSAQYLIWIENTCVIIASIFCYILLRKTIFENNERQQQSLEAITRRCI